MSSEESPVALDGAATTRKSERDPRFYNDLDETLRESWRLLARGVKDRRSPFHTPALASVHPDGSPTVRTVVLRAVDPDLRTLRLHTDVRSAKFRQIAADPRVFLHFYDPARKVQIRLDGVASLHTDDDLVGGAWDGTRDFSRSIYRVAIAPGSEIADPRAMPIDPDAPSHDAGRENFAAVNVSIGALEWLYLAARGHRRARFTWLDGNLKATWLAP